MAKCSWCKGSLYWFAHVYKGKHYCSVTCLAKGKEDPYGEKDTTPNGTLHNNVVDCHNENCGQEKSKKDKTPP